VDVWVLLLWRRRQGEAMRERENTRKQADSIVHACGAIFFFFFVPAVAAAVLSPVC
jgi:hypothetical protein